MNVLHRRLVLAAAGVVAAVVLAGGSCPPPDGESETVWSESFTSDSGFFASISGQSSDRIFAVGGTAGSGAIHRYDGDKWVEESIPDVPGLSWVHTFDDGTPIAAGNGGTILWKRGDSWSLDDLPTDQNMWGVWGASKDDVWAVGGDAFGDGARPVAFHYDGSDWTERSLPGVVKPDRVKALFKVWGTGPDNVYMVGDGGAIVHWDGQKLHDESRSTRNDLISLWGSGPDNIAVVGGRAGGVLYHWNDGSWSDEVSLSPLRNTAGIWVPNDSTAWVGGRAGRVGRVDLTDHSLVCTNLGTTEDFHAVFGVPGGGLYAAGGNLSSQQGPYHGAVWRRGSWTKRRSSPDAGGLGGCRDNRPNSN